MHAQAANLSPAGSRHWCGWSRWQPTMRPAAKPRRRRRAVEPARDLGARARRDARPTSQRRSGRDDGHAALRRARRSQRHGASAAPATTTSCRRWSAWRSATPGTASSWQRTHVNTTCKLLLLTHAFETLGAQLVGWRTDNFNFASQRAIERLGARKDGVLRHHALRRDGTVRDTVMYSLRRGRMARGQGAPALPARQAAQREGDPTMLIDFFYTLRSAKLPVSVKEYLTLLEALQGRRGRPQQRRRLQHRRLLLPGAHRAGEGREALRQVRPRLRRLLQGRRDGGRLHQGRPARVAAQEPRARAQPPRRRPRSRRWAGTS